MTEVVVRLEARTPLHGKATVTTAGSRVRLTATATPLTQGVRVRMTTASTGIGYVGGSTVAAANGHDLAPSESVFIKTNDLSSVYVDCSVNGAVFSYIAI